MSLDITFYDNVPSSPVYYTRQDGSTAVISDLYEDKEVASINITHNLNKMAQAVSIDDRTTLYDVLWHGNELAIPIKLGKDFIKPLLIALPILKENSENLKKFNPANGWGSYEGLISFTEKCLGYALIYQDSTVSFSV